MIITAEDQWASNVVISAGGLLLGLARFIDTGTKTAVRINYLAWADHHNIQLGRVLRPGQSDDDLPQGYYDKDTGEPKAPDIGDDLGNFTETVEWDTLYADGEAYDRLREAGVDVRYCADPARMTYPIALLITGGFETSGGRVLPVISLPRVPDEVRGIIANVVVQLRPLAPTDQRVLQECTFFHRGDPLSEADLDDAFCALSMHRKARRFPLDVIRERVHAEPSGDLPGFVDASALVAESFRLNSSMTWMASETGDDISC